MKRVVVCIMVLFLLAFVALAQAPNPNHLTVSWSYLSDPQRSVSAIAKYDQNSLNLVEFILWSRLPDGTLQWSHQYAPTGGQSAPLGVQSQVAVAFEISPGSSVVNVIALGYKWSGDATQQ
jgi:hypothetical protein